MKKNKMIEFDDVADEYKNVITQSVRGFSGADSDYFSEYKIFEIKKELEGKKILDFGCGVGNSALFISKNVVNFKYFGIDVSEKSIEKAAKNAIRDCTFYHYDVVFVSCVFHHIEPTKHTDVLKEIYRVLAAGGKIIVFEHNPFNPLTQKVVHDCPFDVGVKLISAFKMKKNIRLAGFLHGKIRYTLFFPRKSVFLKLLGCEKYLWWCLLGAQYYCVGTK